MGSKRKSRQNLLQNQPGKSREEGAKSREFNPRMTMMVLNKEVGGGIEGGLLKKLKRKGVY